MRKSDFDELLKSVEEGAEILTERRPASRTITRNVVTRKNVPSSRAWAVCVSEDEPESLTVRRLYQIVPISGELVTTNGYVQVINDAGKIFPYPAEMFLILSLPNEVSRTLKKIA